MIVELTKCTLSGVGCSVFIQRREVGTKKFLSTLLFTVLNNLECVSIMLILAIA
jgi:hypothetical protein